MFKIPIHSFFDNNPQVLDFLFITAYNSIMCWKYQETKCLIIKFMNFKSNPPTLISQPYQLCSLEHIHPKCTKNYSQNRTFRFACHVVEMVEFKEKSIPNFLPWKTFFATLKYLGPDTRAQRENQKENREGRSM